MWLIPLLFAFKTWKNKVHGGSSVLPTFQNLWFAIPGPDPGQSDPAQSVLMRPDGFWRTLPHRGWHEGAAEAFCCNVQLHWALTLVPPVVDCVSLFLLLWWQVHSLYIFLAYSRSFSYLKEPLSYLQHPKQCLTCRRQSINEQKWWCEDGN